MSRFLTELVAKKLAHDTSADRRGTWRLMEILVYESDLLGERVEVPIGFLTDFASVPRIPVAHLLTANTGHEAAVVHDWLYCSHQVSRGMADAVFEEALLAGGEPHWRAWLMWAGVRIGGASAWNAHGQLQPALVQQLIDYAHPEGP